MGFYPYGAFGTFGTTKFGLVPAGIPQIQDVPAAVRSVRSEVKDACGRTHRSSSSIVGQTLQNPRFGQSKEYVIMWFVRHSWIAIRWPQKEKNV